MTVEQLEEFEKMSRQELRDYIDNLKLEADEMREALKKDRKVLERLVALQNHIGDLVDILYKK